MRIALAILVLAAAAAAQDDKTYDLKLDFKVQKGQKFDISETEKQTAITIVTAGGTPVHEEEKEDASTFEARETILEVRDGKRAKVSWEFKKARRLVEGEEQAYGFEGKTVVATIPEDGERTFELEGGGELSEEDLEGLKKSFSSDPKKGKERKSPEEIFAPKKPVKVGESWTPDMAEIAKSFGEGLSVDVEKSTGTFSLKSVETRDGVEMGLIVGKLEFVVDKFGPVELETPLKMAMDLEVLTSLDKGMPQGDMQMKMTMKGTSAATVQGNQMDIEVDLKVDNSKRQRVVK